MPISRYTGNNEKFENLVDNYIDFRDLFTKEDIHHSIKEQCFGFLCEKILKKYYQ